MAYLDKVKLADYTRKEDWLNSISHMVGGGLSIVALLMCCIKSIILRRWDYLLLSFIYGITMIAMYSCSSVYHALRPNNGKKVMRMIQREIVPNNIMRSVISRVSVTFCSRLLISVFPHCRAIKEIR